MQLNIGDPLDWTVDEVVAFLCHNQETPWSQSISQAPRPDPTFLESAIRENIINGEVLLHDVDKEALRNDLGLKALGHRSSMLTAIRYLQGRSPKYQSSKTQFPSGENSPSNYFGRPFTPKAAPHPSPGPSHIARDETSLHSTPQRSSLVCPSVATASVPRKINAADLPLPHNSSNEGNQPLANVQISEESTPPDSVRTPNKENPSERVKPSVTRSRENVLIDDQGRKRRRLDLSALAEPQNSNVLPEAKLKRWYMGPQKLSPPELFYSAGPEDNDRSFMMISSNVPPAQRSSVNKRLCYFYQQKPITLRSTKDLRQWAMVPYRYSGAGECSPTLFTLYTVRNGMCTVSKAQIKDWPELVKSLRNPRPTEFDHDSDPFLYLMQKYPAQKEDEDVYPLYGDSGSEGDLDEETWQEIQEERREAPPPRLRNLTLAEIDSVIDHCIHEFETRWNNTCRPKEEHRAWKLWSSAKSANCTNSKIKTMSRDIGFLKTRQQKVIDAIREGEYSSRDELEKQCQSVEQTVMNIQKNKWRISVLEQETCPARAPAPHRSLSKQRTNPKIDDEESLNSESDAWNDDILEDFIDNSQDLVTQKHPPGAPIFSESDSDDIISPSGARRKSGMRRHPFLGLSSSPSPTPWPNDLPADIECIDLTAGSPARDELRIETPPLNPVRDVVSRPIEDPFKIETSPSLSPSRDLSSSLPASTPQAAPPPHRKSIRSSLPDINDVDQIVSVSWQVIEERQDRRRLLAKLIGSISSAERKKLILKIPRYDESDIRLLTKRAIEALLDGQESLQDLDSSENQLIMRTASFYISWVSCVRLQLEGILRQYVVKAYRDTDEGFGRFFAQLRKRLEAYRSKDEEDAPGETNLDPADTPRKKRKRIVKESQEAKREQESGQRRAERQSKEKASFERKLGRMGLSNTDPSHQAVSFGDPVIYLHPKIGEHVKQHQLEGVRFMWREVIQDDKQQGCILAHTMGLGKTMQVISLLLTISDAAASRDPHIRKQVPERFHRLQVLILCPSSLIENWYEEFRMWTPADSVIGPLRKITSVHAFEDRLRLISAWNQDGGVLLMSYNMFRTWILNKGTERRKAPLTDTEHSKIKECLLDGPNIVVADEAHQMKNPSSALSLAAVQFKSSSRIALTGSPLANNLKDYFTMVDWVANGYLGQYTEFNANFIEPIEQGLYLESTYTERRKSLMKLQVLKTILEPKLNRADISVLAGDLPPKVEFVITVPLTKLQISAYDAYVEATLKGTGDVTNAKIWSWLAILRLCCNHPSCFMNKLLSRTSEPSLGVEFPGDEPIAQAGLPDSEKLVSDQQTLFASVLDMQALELSYRAQLVEQIIERSLEARDKVLVFSHNLATLDYMENILKRSNRRYRRLDGKTPVGDRQVATKQFNSDDVHQVYLISTRAGGLGLNIPGANRVIIFDFLFNPTWEEQAVGRAYRLGQTKPVFVYRFVAGGTFEELVYNKAVFKTQLASRVIDKKNPVRSAVKSVGEYLFPVKEVPAQDITEFIGKDPHVLDEIIKSDNGDEKLIRKIVLTETFQKDENEKLTDEERQGVEQQLSDERLKRTDPEAWEKLMAERQRYLMAPIAPPTPYSPSSISSYVPQRHGSDMQPLRSVPYVVPSHEHNTGPPALAPDMSITQPALRPASAFEPDHPLAGSQNLPPDQVYPPATDIMRSHSENPSTRPSLNGPSNHSVGPSGYDGPAIERTQFEESTESDTDAVDLLQKFRGRECRQQ